MKLFLMRHAEAESGGKKNDIFRNLTPQGKHCASIAATELMKYNISKILVSSSNRTKQTAQIIMRKLTYTKLEILKELYESSAEDIINIISRQNSEDTRLLTIAHNPGIFKLALKLSADNLAQYNMLLKNGMPPANIIILDFNNINNWEKLKTENYSAIT